MQRLFAAIGLLLAAAVASPAQNTTIFPATTTPTQSFPNTQGVELGVRFRSDVDGSITGIRFYKGPADTSVHTGSLWSANGQLLAIGTFTNENSAGWQQLNFAVPIGITANTTYTASYHTTSSFFADYYYFLNHGADNPPLHAPQNGFEANGVYSYGAGGVFPSATYLGINYWVDAVFTLTPTPSRFVDNGDGTITDKTTGLMWEKKTACADISFSDIHCALNFYGWSTNFLDPNGTLFTEFLARMTQSTSSDGVTLVNTCLAGYCDWRIPNIAELKTIRLVPPPCSARPCIDPIFGPTFGWYATSTTFSGVGPNVVWVVNFNDGTVWGSEKSGSYSARAVRGGR